MANPTRDDAFSGPIPELYERHVVPLIFEPYAALLARKVLAETPRTLLELGCGTGVVTRRVAAGLTAGQRLTASDLNPEMLAEARRRLGDQPALAWQTADAQALPFEDRLFDLAYSQFAVMFFPDKRAAFREARRVLKPGAPFLFTTWDRMAANALVDIVTRAACSAFPEDPPDFPDRVPHGYFDHAVIRDDLTAAGFREIEIETHEMTSRAATAHEAAFALLQGTPLRAEIAARDPAKLDPITQAAAGIIAQRHGEPVAAPMRAFVVRAA